MGHIHSVYDTDNHFRVNAITRAISDVSKSKTCLIQRDHNSERFTFEIPRIVEGHDMMDCNVVQVHYLNISNSGSERTEGVYEVDDLQISPASEDMVICSWLISRNATKLVGSLKFLLRFACATGEEVDYAWHTSTYGGIKISEGIFNGEEIDEEYPDILAQWETRIAACEDICNDVDTFNERLETIEEGVADYKDRFDAMAKDIADLKYKPIEIVSFTHDAGVQELGAVVKTVYLSWAISKQPAKLTLDGQEMDKDATGFGKGWYAPTYCRETTRFTLVATDERNATASKTATLSFYNGIYYGAAADPAVIDSDFIMSLSGKTLADQKNRTVTIKGGDGLYAWYAYPKRLGKSLFNIGGFDYEYAVETVSFTNSLGYNEDYYVYRSGQFAPASLSVTVKDGG